MFSFRSQHDPPLEVRSGNPLHTPEEGEHREHLYYHSAIFVRLPHFPYGPTCAFFSAITLRQFPAQCPPVDQLFYYSMRHYGFGGEANKVVKTFNYVMQDLANVVYAQVGGLRVKNKITASFAIVNYEFLAANGERFTTLEMDKQHELPKGCGYL